MLGSSIEGTDETLLCVCGLWGDAGTTAASSSEDRLSSSDSSEKSTSDDGIQTLNPLLDCETADGADDID